MPVLLPVLVHTPAHSGVAGVLHYRHSAALPPGTLVRVPLGRRETMGVVWEAAADDALDAQALEAERVRDIAGVLDGLAPLDAGWRRLVAFAARYYQRSAGEVALAALPPQLRTLDGVQLARRLKRQSPAAARDPGAEASPPQALPELTAEQAASRASVGERRPVPRVDP